MIYTPCGIDHGPEMLGLTAEATGLSPLRPEYCSNPPVVLRKGSTCYLNPLPMVIIGGSRNVSKHI